MADIIWTDVVALIASMSAITTDAQNAILPYVNIALDGDFFGGEDGQTYKLARIYLAAHIATTATGGDAAPAGPVTEEHEGGLGRTYAAIAGAQSCNTHQSTSYGRLYDEIVRGSPNRLGASS